MWCTDLQAWPLIICERKVSILTCLIKISSYRLAIATYFAIDCDRIEPGTDFVFDADALFNTCLTTALYKFFVNRPDKETALARSLATFSRGFFFDYIVIVESNLPDHNLELVFHSLNIKHS